MKNYKIQIVRIIYFLILYNFFLLRLIFCSPLLPEIVPEGIKFLYKDPKAKSVTIAGEFNNWDMKKNPLKKSPEGIWSTVIPLKDGRYEYKFIINGQWMPGDNLIVEIKKDEKTGKLYLVKQKPKILEYTSKVKLSGKYFMLYPYIEFPSGKFLSSLGHHLDLDGFVKPTKETEIFFRTEFNSEDKTRTIIFKKGYFNINLGMDYFLKMFYNHKFLYFDNPLKILNQPVGLRYEEIDFVEEYNPYKTFGINSQGIYFKGMPLGLNVETVYSDMYVNPSDILGVRIKTPEISQKLRIGYTYLFSRGIPWKYDINADGWFPDPGYIVNRSTDTTKYEQPWYKGFVYNEFSSLDLKFNFLPGIIVFGETGWNSINLISHRWNEGVGKDSPINKTWDISDSLIFLYGVRTKFLSRLNLEFYLKDEDIKFYQTIINDSQVKFNYESRPKKKTNSLKIRYDITDKDYFGISFTEQKNSFFDSVIESELSPYKENIAYSGIGENAPMFVVKEKFSLVPIIKFSFKEKIGIKLINNLSNYKVYSEPGNRIISHSSNNIKKMTISEFLMNLTYNITDSLVIEPNFRYYIYAVEEEVKNFFVVYGGISVLKNNFLIHLGYGIDPRWFDEDVFESYDRREKFLYQEYLNKGNIVLAEESLQKLQQIFFRIGAKF